MNKNVVKIKTILMQYSIKHEPCNSFFLRRFMKKHNTAEVKRSINPVPIIPKTKTMYDFVPAVEFLLGEITLGSIGGGVDGSAL